MNLEILNAARGLLADVTPLKTDCGLLCDRACCRPDDDAGGDVWLFPGEEGAECDWADARECVLPVSGARAMAIRCREMCPRDARPFCCRIFPLAPYFSKKRSAWRVRMDRRAWMLCPLCACGVRGLNPEFVSAAQKAVEALAADEDGERFLQALAEEEAAYRMKL